MSLPINLFTSSSSVNIPFPSYLLNPPVYHPTQQELELLQFYKRQHAETLFKSLIEQEEKRLLDAHIIEYFIPNIELVDRPPSLRVLLEMSKCHPISNFNHLIDLLYSKACKCLLRSSNRYTEEEIKLAMRVSLVMNMRLTSCDYIKTSIDYYRINRRFQNTDETIEAAQTAMATIISTIYSEEKKTNPTQNLDKLQKKKMGDSTVVHECHICQSEITYNQMYYKLPCKHFYHADEKDCLQEKTIVNWLQTSDVCPVCRAKVVIEENNEKKETVEVDEKYDVDNTNNIDNINDTNLPL